MADWSYQGDLTIPLDWIRFTVGDTNPQDPLMSDTEIKCILSITGSKEQAAKSCMEHILILLSARVDFKNGPASVNESDRYERYEKQYRQYAKDLNTSSLNIPVVNTSPGVFHIGGMDS